MSFSIQVFQSTGITTRIPIIIPKTLDPQPQFWSAVAKGGMWDAEVFVYGVFEELLGLTSWLNYHLEILNANGTPVWWGWIDSVEIVAGGLRRGITLDQMSNRVMVRYTKRGAGGAVSAADTSWLDEAYSQAAWGIRETRLSPQSPMTTNEATAYRATVLSNVSGPRYTLFPDTSGPVTRLYCRGFWQRTKHKYYSQPSGLVESSNPGTPYPLGLGYVDFQTSFAVRGPFVSSYGGRLKNFGTGYKFRVTGASAPNNLTYTVEGADDRDARTYSSTGVSFNANDDILDTNGGLGGLDSNDIFWLSGSPANSGSHIVDKNGAAAIEVNGTFHGGVIVTEAAGATINFFRGNQVRVSPAPGANQGAGTPITVTVWGERYYSTFTLPVTGSWTVDSIDIRLQKVGIPSDGVKIQLVADSAGSPGAVLKEATVSSTNIPTEMDWVQFDFDNLQQLNFGTTYGLLITRTGANDWDDFYLIDMDLYGLYSGGASKAYDGTAYQTIAADLLFRVVGGTDTGAQVTSILQSVSEFVDILPATSGVVANQYRTGELKAFDELEVLLDTGSSVNKRLIAATTRTKAVVISTKPDKTAARWLWQSEDALLDLLGQPAEEGFLPAGEWVKLGDAPSLGPWAALSPAFIERAEYRVGRGWNLSPEGSEDPYDTGVKYE